MKNIKEKMIGGVKVVILGLILATGVGYISAWSGPTGAPPSGNVSAPINASYSSQSKLGSLSINTSTSSPYTNGLLAFGESVFTSNASGSSAIQINDGSAQPGYVLTSQDSSGTAEWEPAGAAGTSTHGMKIYTTPGTYTWTAPAGVTSATIEVFGGSGTVFTYPAEGGNPNGQFDGGMGGYAKGLYTLTPGQSYTVTVGSGGTYTGYSPDKYSYTSTNFGGTSSFANLISATGGGVCTYPYDPAPCTQSDFNLPINGVGSGTLNGIAGEYTNVGVGDDSNGDGYTGAVIISY